MLGDGVTAVQTEGPRSLEAVEMHFEAKDWAANGVLLLEAEGDVCESGTGGDAHDGEFSASWDTPKDGCYRVDAHSAGQKCGFNSPVALTIDWCAGRTETLKYTPGADGWTPLGVFPFHPGNLGGITQEEGAVDAFRLVPVPDCRVEKAPVFGSLTVDTDADEMPEDLASQLVDKLENMGDALTAFFHPYIEKTRRLSGDVDEEGAEVVAEPSNHVVVDFDIAKLGSQPTEAAVQEATQLIFSLLDTVECGHAASFKLDESGDAKTVRPKGDGRGLVWLGAASLGMLALVAAGIASAIIARQSADDTAQPKPVFVTPKEDTTDVIEEEKKPQVEDDNVSTVTPVSLPDSLPSLDGEDNKAEQQV
jgi:hypothetical protein